MKKPIPLTPFTKGGIDKPYAERAIDKTIKELLPEFYNQYNLGMDGGQSSPSVRI